MFCVLLHLFFTASSPHSALLTELDGQAVCNTDLDIIFIADTNYSSIDLTEKRINEIIATSTMASHRTNRML